MLRPIFWPVIVPSLLFAIGVGSTVPVLIGISVVSFLETIRKHLG